MSRPQGQGHRKSQSTSALSLLASPSSLSSSSTHEQSRFRASQHPALGRVEESSSSASVPTLPGISVTGHGTPKRSRSIGAVVGVDEVKGWLGDVCSVYLIGIPLTREMQVMSLRSSDRRRLAALKSLEKTLVRCCARVGERGKQRSSAFDEGISLAEFIGLQGALPCAQLVVAFLADRSSSCLPSLAVHARYPDT